MQLQIWAAIGGAAFAWGTTGVATRAALNDGVPPIAMVTYRAILATVILWALLKLRGWEIPRDRATWSTGVVQGVFQLSLPFVLFTLAYENASAGFVGLLVALVPLGTAGIAHFRLPEEPMNLAKAVGLTVAFIGVAFSSSAETAASRRKASRWLRPCWQLVRFCRSRLPAYLPGGEPNVSIPWS